jgi:hypothetical protein
MPPAATSLRRGPGGGATSASGENLRIATENQVRAFAESIVQAGDRATRSLFAALGTLVDALSRMPGGRSIILFSPGAYIPARFRRQQERLIVDALRARRDQRRQSARRLHPERSGRSVHIDGPLGFGRDQRAYKLHGNGHLGHGWKVHPR